MKTLTRILSSFSLVLVMAFSVHAQDVFKIAPVGIGTVSPQQALDVNGNIKFSGALMPNGIPGTTGNILLSGGGSPASPTWLANGATGLVLQSPGPGVPSWVSANAALTKSNIVNGGANSVVVVTNGTGQVVGGSNVSLDVQGTSGGILYGTGIGNSALFTSSGLSGQVLTSTGSTAPIYAAYGYWNLSGNAGTNPTINFIGTTDNVPLVFETEAAYAGQIDAFGGNDNTYMGAGASNEANFVLSGAGNNDAGQYNVAFGDGVLGQNTTGIGNVGFGGYFSLILNTSGNYNVALGRALESNYQGNGNVATGFDALWEASGTASYNIAIGYNAGYIYTDGAVGSASGLPSAIGNFNTAVGYEALYINNVTNNAVSNTAIGNYALFNTTGKQNTAVGDSALLTNVGGNYNTALGFFANVNSSAYTNATAIGYSAIAPAGNSITLGNTSVAYSAITGAGLYLPGYKNIGAILYNSTTGGLVASSSPGTSGQYLQSNSAGVPTWATVTPGSGSVTTVTGTAPIIINGTWNVNIQGNSANTDKGGVLYSAGSGTSALFTSAGSAGLVLTSTGTGAPIWTAPPIIAWSLTGNSGITSSNFIGTTNANNLVFHVDNAYAGNIDLPTTSGGNGNVYLGYGVSSKSATAGTATSDAGTNNVAVGYETFTGTSTRNIFLGNEAAAASGGGATTPTGSDNIGLGYHVLYNLTTGTGNTIGAPGASAANGNGQGTGGINAGNYNTAFGYSAMGVTAVTGTYSINNNVAIGQQTLNSAYTATINSAVAMGYQSQGGSIASHNTSFGSSAIEGGTAGWTNTYGTAVGDSALTFAGSAFAGTYNTGFGYFAVSGKSLTNTTSIGARADATVSNTILLGAINGVNGNTLTNVNVGIGTTTPKQKLEVGPSSSAIRIDGLENTGAYNTQLGTKGNIVYVNNITGDLYSLPNGTNGQVLTLNSNGVPSWGASVANSITKYNIVPGAGSSVFVNNGTGQVVGSGNVSLDVQGTAGGVFYGNGVGTPAAFTAAGTAGDVLISQGTGVPAWGSENSTLTKYNIVNGGASSRVVVTNGTNQVVGSGNVTLDVQGTSNSVLLGQGTGNSAIFSSAGTSGQVLTSNGTAAPSWAAANYNAWLFTGNTVGAPYGTYILGTLQLGATNLPVEFLSNSNSPAIYTTDALLDNVNGNVYFGGNVNGGWPGGNGTAVLNAASHNVGIGNGAFDVANSSGTALTSSGAGLAGGVINDVFIGYGCGISMYVANSTAIGTTSQRNIDGPGYTVGGPNTSMGNFAFRSSNGGQGFTTTGNHNTAFGNENEYGATTSSYNTSVGDQSMSAINNGGTSYSYNTSAGAYALNAVSTGTYNTALGYQALDANTSGANNTAVGYTALNVNGSHNTALGYTATVGSAAYANATAVGYSASAPASNSVTLGKSTATSLYLPGYTSSGDILYTSANTGLVASLPPGTSGYYLKSNGPGSVPSWASVSTVSGTVTNVIGTAPITIAPSSFWVVGIQGTNSNEGGVLYSAGSGTSALFTSAGTTGQVLTSTGTGAPAWSTITVPAWYLTGNAGTIPSADFIGTTDDKQFVFMSSYSYYFGNYNNPEAGSIDPQFVGATTYGNVYLGVANADNSNGPAGNNDKGTYNVAFGRGTLGNITSGTNDVALGTQNATKNNGSNDITIGNGLFFYGSASGLSAIGSVTNYNTASGNDVTLMGFNAYNGSGTGSFNTALGYNSLYTGGGGGGNTSVGNYAAYSTTGSKNTAVGDSALYTTTSGVENSALGYQANVATASLSNATAIGYKASATATNSVTLGNTSANALYLPGYNTAGSFLYTSNANGLVSSLPSEVTSGQLLQSNGLGSAPSWNFVTPGTGTVTNVTATAPATVAGSWVVGLQGNSSNTDKGGVLYSTGSASAAVFTPTPSAAGLVLLSGGSGAAPTWGTSPSSGWKIVGNSGTVSGVNFVGTTDDNQLFFHNGGSYAENGYSGAIDPQMVGVTTKGNTYMGAAQSTNSDYGAGDNDAGTYNVAMGNGALGEITTGATNNVAIGYNSNVTYSSQNMTASNDVSVGYTAIRRNVTGSGEVAIGINAMCFLQSVSAPPAIPNNYNSAVGFQSMYGTGGGGTNSFGLYNAALGYEALFLTGTTTQSSNTVVGYQAAMLTTASKNTAIGDSALYSNTTGAYNTALGYQATVPSGAITNATAIGYQAIAPANNSIALGNAAATSLYLPGYASVGSLYYTSANTGLVASLGPGTSGYYLESHGAGNTPTWAPVSSIHGTVTNVTGTAPIIIAPASTWVVGIQGTNAGGVLYSAGSGTSALFTSAGSTGQVLTSNGTGAPTWGALPVTAWSLTGNSGTNPAINFVGTLDDQPLRIESGNTYAGSIDPQLVGATTKGNTALGAPQTSNDDYSADSYSAGNDEGTYNTALGNGALGDNATGINNVAIGYNTNVSYNTASAGSMSNDVSIGLNAMVRNVTGSGEVAIGENAMRFIQNNSSPPAASADWYNTAVGNASMYGQGSSTSFGVYNTAEGYEALYSGTASGRSSNTAIGSWAAYNTTASRNTAIGDSALYSNTTGAYNTALGYQATVSAGAITNVTAIGANVTATTTNTLILGNGAARVGINTSTPQQLLELGGSTATARIDALKNAGSYNKSIAANGNIVYVNSATGDLYSLPNGTTGTILSLNSNGVPTWAAPSSSNLTTYSIVPAAGSSVVVGNGLNQVVGSSNVTVDVQGAAGGVFYGTGANNPAAFTSAGASGLVLQSNGTGVPTWAAANFNAWLLTGNTGTTPGTNFIGTTDANRLAFKVDAITAGTIDLPASLGGNGNAYYGQYINYYNNEVVTSGTTIGDIGTNNTAIGMYAFDQPSNTGGGDNYNIAVGYNMAGGTGDAVPTGGVTGNYNIGFGPNSLYILTSGNGNVIVSNNSGQHIEGGSYNTGFGFFNLGNQFIYNYVGSSNTAAGYYAIVANNGGYLNSNTGVGAAALENTTANKNTALGSNALANLSSGAYNTAVGDSAYYATAITGANNTAFGALTTISNGAFNNATAIGYKAAANAANSITLGNTAATSLYVPGYNTVGSLLYTSAPNGLVASTGAGTSGYYLQSNGTGAAPAWSNVSIGSGTVTNITGTAPITVAGSWNVGIQGNSSNTDKGGVLYSNGSASPAQFTPTATAANMELVSSASGAAPTWQLQSSVTSSWATAGNSGTNPGTDFIGTTDANRLVFRLNTASVAYNAGTIDLPTTLGGNGNAYYGLGIGYENNGVAVSSGDEGTNNTIFGCLALLYANSTTGGFNNNIAMGYDDMSTGATTDASGNYNIGMGPNNLYWLTTGSDNVVLSPNAGQHIRTGNNNTGFGYFDFGNAGADSYVGSSNVAAGYQALLSNTTSVANINSNTAIGKSTLPVAIAGKNTAIGSGALSVLSSGEYNTAVGDSAFNATLTTGLYNTAIGAQASITGAALTNATAIGYQAKATASFSITLGNTAATSLYVPGYNTVGSLLYTANSNGLVASTGAGTSGNLLVVSTSGIPTWSNVSAGGGTVTNLTGTAPIVVTGSSPWNVGIQGSSSYNDAGGVLYSTGSSTAAAFTPQPSAASLALTATGAGGAPTWAPLSGAVSAWYLTGNSNATASSFVGTTTANRLILNVNSNVSGTIDLPATLGGNGNAYYGYRTSYQNGATVTSGATIGDVGTYNTAIGWEALEFPSNSSGGSNYNIAIGANDIDGGTATAANTGSYNIGTGFNNLYELTSGSGNVSLSARSAHNIETGSYNTGFGRLIYSNPNAGNGVGSFNTAAGYEALQATANGTANAINSNTGIGDLALSSATTSKNTAVGDSALFATTAAEYNTAVGYQALGSTVLVASDNYNTALGYLANTSVATITNATAIGAHAYASVSNTIVLGDIAGVNSAAASPVIATNVGIGTNVPATDADLAIKTGHVETQGQLANTVGAIIAGAGVGSSASFVNSTDVGGQITITTGTSGWGTGPQAEVLFSNPYKYAPIIVLTPADPNSSTAMIANQVYPTSGTTAFSINFGAAATAQTSYTFNYFAIETPNTTPVVQPAFPIPGACYVPVTLTNSTSSNTVTNFAQMITVNSSAYSALELAGLTNIEFTVGGPAGIGTPLYAWVESNATTSSTNTVWWVNLGSNDIPANSTLTVYMNFMPSAVMGVPTGPTSYTGEAPQLSGTYAADDNGALVFPEFYDNFIGPTDAKWSKATQNPNTTVSATYSDGLTESISGSPVGNWYGVYETTFSSALNNVSETYAKFSAGLAMTTTGPASSSDATGANSNGTNGCVFPYVASGTPASDGLDAQFGSGNDLFGEYGSCQTAPSANGATYAGTAPSASTFYVFSYYMTNPAASELSYDATGFFLNSGSVTTPPPYGAQVGPSSEVGLGGSSGSSNVFQWFRIRPAYQTTSAGGASSLMPAVSIGTLACE